MGLQIGELFMLGFRGPQIPQWMAVMKRPALHPLESAAFSRRTPTADIPFCH